MPLPSRLEDYGIPYGYAPCLVAHPGLLDREPQTVKLFLAASGEGWRLAAQDSDAAAEELVRLAREDSGIELDHELCRRSAAYIGSKCLTRDVFGLCFKTTLSHLNSKLTQKP